MADETKDPAADSNTPVPPGGDQGTPPIPPQPAPPAKPDPIAEDVGLVRPAPASVQPAAAANPLQDDIAKILQAVKLPERRDAALPNGKAVQNEQKVFDTTIADPESKIRMSPAESEPIKTEAPTGESSIRSVHTLKQDLQHVVRDQKMSLVHAVALEEEKQRVPESMPVESASRAHARGTIFAIVLLLVLGLLALGGVYMVMHNSVGQPQAPNDSLVFAEQAYTFPIDNQSPIELKATLAQARGASSATLGAITQIVPVTPAAADDGTPSVRQATFTEFMTALGTHVPPDALRALHNEFFFGIHTVDKNAPLIVVPVISYDRAFAGMLAWEKTLNADLAPIFTPVPTLTLGPDGIPTERTFSDTIMRNYDVRALKDDAGAIQLYYSFPTRDILVIAESPYTFTELLSRLQAQRRL